MPKLCNIDIDRCQETYKKLKEFIVELKKKFLIKEVYLYGSFATGEIHQGSDIDLIIIGSFEGKMPKRIREILKLTDLPLEPLVYTPEEFKRIYKTSPFLKEISKTWKRL